MFENKMSKRLTRYGCFEYVPFLRFSNLQHQNGNFTEVMFQIFLYLQTTIGFSKLSLTAFPLKNFRP
jgi:hypothetical protein